MNAMNINIVVLAGGLAVLVILGAIYLFISLMGSSRKLSRQRLMKMKDRHQGTKKETDHARAIRSIQQSGGLDQFFVSLLPQKKALEARLARAGYQISLSRYMTYVAIGAVFLWVFFLLSGMKLLVALMLAFAMGVGLPHFWVGKMMNRRRDKFIQQFPEALDLMVRGLKSGLPVNECIISVGQEVSAPCGTEFTRVADEMRLGKQLEEALWEASERLEINDFKFFVISLSVQRETGGNLGETLENLATILRSRKAMKLKIAALSSEAKASAWIVGALPFIMYGLIMALNYDYGVVLITHPTAIMAAIGGLVWMSIGIFVMSQMIDFEV